MATKGQWLWSIRKLVKQYDDGEHTGKIPDCPLCVRAKINNLIEARRTSCKACIYQRLFPSYGWQICADNGPDFETEKDARAEWLRTEVIPDVKALPKDDPFFTGGK